MRNRNRSIRSKASWLLSAALLAQTFAYAGGASAAEATESSAVTDVPATGTVEKAPYVEGEVLVTYKPGVRSADTSKLRQSFALATKQRIASMGAELLKLPDGADVEETVEKLENSGLVAHAQPNYLYYPSESASDAIGGGGSFVSGDPTFVDYRQNWALENLGQLIENDPGYGITGTYGVDIGAVPAWSFVSGVSLDTVVVAVIDTGVDISHPELADKIWTNPDEIPGNQIDDDGNGMVDDVHGWDFVNDDATVFDDAAEDEHGTHVAATIAGRLDNGGGAGAAVNVKIMPLKFIGEDGGTTASIVRALEYAADHGVRITNNSWNGISGEEDAVLSQAIEAADALFVGSAGNGDLYGEGLDTDTAAVSPNNLRSEKQIIVAAVDPSGNLASFSNYGDETVHIGAPGVAIYNAVPGGKYEYLDGTSMAAPHVAAVAAMIMGQKRLSVAQTKQLLLESGKPLPSLNGKTVSGKMVNMYNAIATSVSEVSLEADNPKEFANTSINVSFRSSTYGALKAGRDSVTMVLSGIGFNPNNIVPGVVTINGTPLNAGDVISNGTGGPVKLRLPVDVAAGAVVSIRFSVEAGMVAGEAGTYTVDVRTSADPRPATGRHTVGADASLKVVRYDRSDFPSEAAADRTVTGVVYATVSNETFAGTIGETFGPDKVMMYNLPQGVQFKVVKESDTTVSMSVYGVSTSGSPMDYVYFSFLSGAFAGGDVSKVSNAQQLFIWNYKTSASVFFTNRTFVESDANEGSIQTTATAMLFGDRFAGANGSILPPEAIQITGVPSGLTAVATKVSPEIVEISLSGKASKHAVADSVENIQVTFAESAFVGLAAKSQTTFSQFKILYKDGAGKPGNVTAVQDGAYVDLSWSPSANADHYVISASVEEGKFFGFDRTEETQYTDVIFGIVPAQVQYRIDAYRGKVVTHSDPVTVNLTSENTYFEGYVDLNGRPADGTKLTVKNANGTVRYTATFDAENPEASLTDQYGIAEATDMEDTLFVYFYAPNGTYTVLVENGTWKAERTVTKGSEWMLGEPTSDFEMALYHVGIIETLSLAAPSNNQSPGPIFGGGGPIFFPPATPTGPPAADNPNGEFIYKPSAAKETRNGVEVSVVAVTAEDLAQALTGAKTSGKLVIDLETEGAAEVRLPAGTLAEAEGVPVVEIRTKTASYRIPTSLLDPAELAAKFGVAPGSEWTVVVEMFPVTGATAEQIGASASGRGASVVGDPIDFAMRVETNGQTYEYNDFGSTYVERTVTAARSLNARTATAAMYDPETGALSFVPATFRSQGGGTVVTMKRNGNSVYVLLESKRSFADMASHWAKADVELLAGKLVLNGTGPDTFSPEARVTRAEFASMLTRALGLSPNAEAAGFSDVTEGAWYEGAVGAAVATGLVTGFEDGTFRPNERVTREQMAVMFERALKFAGGLVPSTGGAAFTDRESISPWAVKAVASVSAAGIVGGNPDGTFAPSAEANRAQAAVMLGRLLKRVGFID